MTQLLLSLALVCVSYLLPYFGYFILGTLEFFPISQKEFQLPKRKVRPLDRLARYLTVVDLY